MRRHFVNRLPLADNHRLTLRTVYILPSRIGIMFAITLALLLLTSINYQLNLGFLLTFLVAGCAAISGLAAHENLRGLSLHLLPPEPGFAGSAADVSVRVVNPTRRERFSLTLLIDTAPDAAEFDVPAQGECVVHLQLPLVRRGRRALPPLRLSTRFPLGAFSVWTIWRPATRVTVYPAPETPAPPLPPGEPVFGHGTQTVAGRGFAEFDGVRARRDGDSLRLMVWKKFAQTGIPISRDAPQTQRAVLQLDAAHTGLRDHEAVLSRLTAWVLAAEKQGAPYGLRQGGVQLAPSVGAAHRAACLQTLADA